MNGATAFNVLITVVATAAAAAAFWGANRATRAKAQSDNRAVDAAAYTRATDIYESTINALRAEVGRLTEEVKGVRNELSQLRTTNDHLVTELAHLRSQEHAELTVLRERDTGRLTAYDNPNQPGNPDQPDDGP